MLYQSKFIRRRLPFTLLVYKRLPDFLFSFYSETEDQLDTTVGFEGRAKVEARLRQLEGGTYVKKGELTAQKTAKYDAVAAKTAAAAPAYNEASDVFLDDTKPAAKDVEDEDDSPPKKKSKKEKKKKKSLDSESKSKKRKSEAVDDGDDEEARKAAKKAKKKEKRKSKE